MSMRRFLPAFALCLAALPVLAVQPGEQLADRALELRARELSGGLRCLVCQNQSIDDSDAPLARDLRLLVRERLVAGDSDSAVKDFIVSRYGEFVLLRPPFTWNTLLLWLSPFAILLAGALALMHRGRLRVSGDSAMRPSPLSEDEQHKLETMLKRDGT